MTMYRPRHLSIHAFWWDGSWKQFKENIPKKDLKRFTYDSFDQTVWFKPKDYNSKVGLPGGLYIYRNSYDYNAMKPSQFHYFFRKCK